MSLPPVPSAAPERYALVSGISAYRLSQITRRVTLVLTLLWLIVGLGAGVYLGARGRAPLTTGDIALLVAVGFVPLAVAAALTGVAARRDRAEGAAGYTTRTTGRTSFDQVDPTTGIVVRRAFSAVYTPVAGSAATSATPGPARTASANLSASASGTEYFPVPADARRSAAVTYTIAVAIFLGILLALLLPVAFTVRGGHDRDMFLLTVTVTLAGVALIITGTLVAVARQSRSRVRRVAALRPADVVFLSPRTPELTRALRAAALPSDAVSFGGRLVVSAGSDGIALWRGSTRYGPRLTLGWDRIERVQAGRLMVASGRSQASYRTAHVFVTATPHPIDVPLPILNSRGLAAASAPYANEVMGALARYAPVDAEQG
ncbi:hypothetical protein [Microbacterium dextranolyticum]|uniref:Uncharacterized protein n=1 Tax=Microbacterium dextranolyticum TaxID=36806 RepID=A0A9W6HKR1_9MICO|nr:hypothetical protein [Microbacterium dextranolyticum]MBM7462200.1 uncharacterized membrane protein YhaH (DUF805 family) [Microbacterium dextranolyticum]GLJ94450.1 hypothetical protein GCM10017591_05110 [Microbacterium dextranolyticum]